MIRNRYNYIYTLLLIVISGVMGVKMSASDRLYLSEFSVLPGETAQLELKLENTQEYYGFQLDIVLPEGLTFVTTDGVAQVVLSSRADDTFIPVSNLVSDRHIVFGAFSAQQHAISGNDGALIHAAVRASEEFAGGYMKISDIIFSDLTHRDVEFSDFTYNIALTQIKVESITLNYSELTLYSGETAQLCASVLPENATNKLIVWSSSNPLVAIVDESGSIRAINNGETDIVASIGDVNVVCHVTVDGPLLTWEQDFQCVPGDRVELNASKDKRSSLSFRCVVPDGGYQRAEVEEEEGKWFVAFPDEGTYILEASLMEHPEIVVRKIFNIVFNPEELLYIDGIYYRYVDESKSALKVVRGYNVYSGDYSIPSLVNGVPVKAIESYAFYSCSELGNVFISQGIESIGDQSFGNGSISSISIPESVKFISNYAFNALDEIDGHYSLMSISLYGRIPVEVNESIFNGYIDYDQCELHIPEGTLAEYRQAEVWKNFTNIIEDLPDMVIPIESISLEIEGTLSIRIGDTYELVAVITPENASNKILRWSSSDENVATVDNSGMVTAISDGECVITARTLDGSDKNVSCSVRVSPVLIETISLNPIEWNGIIGDKFQISYAVLPENATDKSVEWSSSDENVATVDNSGMVTLINTGNCVIFVTSMDGSNVSSECNVIVCKDSGIGSTLVDGNVRFDVYRLDGVLVRKNCEKNDLLQLGTGLYLLHNGEWTFKVRIP